ncbi:MAG: 4Fe-4S binding protein [Chitinivibrionales bacterium]|nr:4Fe-4S binding protein [Chitinivibrionales bacterium]MBD3356643.1 4Fe-4S binding protein [Chitinivibrionales bacterium]
MRNLRTIRIVNQSIFFTLFAVSLLVTAPNAVGWFFWLNPLVGILTSVATRAPVFPALAVGIVVLIVTVLLGRVFCGGVCPLGAVIDFSDRYLFRRMRSSRRRPPKYLRRLKYILLTVSLVGALSGVLYPLFFDPILLATRIATLVILPLGRIVMIDMHGLVKPLLDAAGAYRLSLITLRSPLYYGTLGALALALVIIGGGFWDRRFWCQYLCPSGAFFGLLSRFALFRRKVDYDNCSDCKRCAATLCPTRAIDERDYRVTSTAECVLCGLCREKNKRCTSFGFASPKRSVVRGADVERRHFVAGALGGALTLPFLRANAFDRRDNSGRLIRPPGAVPDDEFNSRCLGCAHCLKACPTNAIQPCTFADGAHRLFTPKIVARVGGCEETCHLCGHVCPTGAIRKLSYEEKRFVKIGTAVIDRRRCLAWEQNKECVVCDEVCPYNAITTHFLETTTGPFRVPVVDEDLCLGCGMCEHHCPIFDKAAIVVYKFGEQRKSSGPYVSEWKKERILERRRKSDREAIGRSFGLPPSELGSSGSNRMEADTNTTRRREDTKLPPGFSLD